MIYPDNFESKVGFDAVRRRLGELCLSTIGREEVASMRFLSDLRQLTPLLEQVAECKAMAEAGEALPLNFIADVRPQLRVIRAVGTWLTEADLHNLRRTLTTIADVAAYFTREEMAARYPRLAAFTASMQSFPVVVATIDRILDRQGNIKDNASPELMKLRRELASAGGSVNAIMRRVMAQGRADGYFDADTAPAVRDGRLVLPVEAQHKRRINGIVHDQSATGRTFYIEPAEVVEVNNRIRELEADIQREIIRILTVVTDELRPLADEIAGAIAALGRLDFIRAKALFAAHYGGALPHLSGKSEIEWYHAVHPTLLMALSEQGKDVVPLDITLSKAHRILVISGPNAGGKSVCLKTVGVLQYMMQCGMLPLLYDNSHMGVFADIFIDIGDEQSIEDDLSTYSSHLRNMKTFVTRANHRSLVLVDEMGGGTEPLIGGAIAQAVLGVLNRNRCFGVITTHYQNLKQYADATPGLVNGAMLYDRQLMRPLFSLAIGHPGSSFAVEIARKSGMPAEIIEEAERIVGSDYINTDKFLLDIARDRRYWENKRADVHAKDKHLQSLVDRYDSEVDTLNHQRKAILREARAEAQQILAQANAQIERTIHQIKEAQAERERTKLIRSQLEEYKARLAADLAADADASPVPQLKAPAGHRRKASKPQSEPKTEQIGVGSFVTIEGSNAVGVVAAIEGKKAKVTFGNLTTTTRLDKLQATDRRPAADEGNRSMSAAASDEIRRRQLAFKQDIDVRGMRADEAVQAVTYFIDDAIQFNQSVVRILHGTGNGILREQIRRYLRSVKGIRSFHDEHVQFGGAGITVVEFE